MRVWELTERLIANKDWDDWCYVWFDNNRVRLRDVISETECELLSKRRSDLWKVLGFPEYAWWTAEWEHIANDTFGSYYTDLWLDKFDFDPVSWTVEWESSMREVRYDQETEVLFREGQGDFLDSICTRFLRLLGRWPSNRRFLIP
jgi:hypothetical protein